MKGQLFLSTVICDQVDWSLQGGLQGDVHSVIQWHCHQGPRFFPSFHRSVVDLSPEVSGSLAEPYPELHAEMTMYRGNAERVSFYEPFWRMRKNLLGAPLQTSLSLYWPKLGHRPKHGLVVTRAKFSSDHSVSPPELRSLPLRCMTLCRWGGYLNQTGFLLGKKKSGMEAGWSVSRVHNSFGYLPSAFVHFWMCGCSLNINVHNVFS